MAKALSILEVMSTFKKPTISTSYPPSNELEHLDALRKYNILDTLPEAAFDRITKLAARLFKVQSAAISFPDVSRVWFKSCYGLAIQSIAQQVSISSYVPCDREIVTILDLQQEEGLLSNSYEFRELGMRFYASAPLITADGSYLGTISLLDPNPGYPLTEEQKETLGDLAAMVVDELELRLAAYKATQLDTALLEVSRGVASAKGEAFFANLVLHFTKVLGVAYTYIGLISPKETETVKTIATCVHGQIVDNFEYLLRDTPCEEVIRQRKLCCYPSGLPKLFPKATGVKTLNVESFIAVPILNSHGEPLAILVVMDNKPLINIQLAESLLTIFALQIATELEQQQVQRNLENLVEQSTLELSQSNQLLQAQIAERQQAEVKLQKEQELLRVLLEHVQAGIVACDAEGALTLFNKTAREFHGLPETPLTPEQWAEYYSLYEPDGKTLMRTEQIPLFRALQGELLERVEMVIRSQEGVVRTVLASGQAITDGQGQKQGAVVVMHDITDRKQAEAELLISDVALQQMPDAILLTDLEGRIQRWLGNAEHIFGYTAAEAIGQPVSILHHPDVVERMTAEIVTALQTTGEFRGEIPCVRKDGLEIAIETTAKTVNDQNGKPNFLIGINRDITERKQLEKERTQLLQQQVREQAARLKAEADQWQAKSLAEISSMLASSLDYERTLASVADLVVPFFADWCAIDLWQGQQTIDRVAIAHCDPKKVKLGWELHRQYPRHINAAEGVAKVLRTGQTEIACQIHDEDLARVVKDEKYLQILQELGLKSCIISPLIARGQTLGAITFATAESSRYYGSNDVALAEDIAHRAAIAIDNARLYREAQEAQQVAERSANRIARLQSVTAALSESLTPTQVAEVIVDQGMAALGASFGLIALLNDAHTELEIVRIVGCELDSITDWQKFPVDTPVPLAEAVLTKQPIWGETSEQRAINYPYVAQAYQQHQFSTWISLPLIVESRAVGGLSFGFTAHQQLDEEEKSFMLALAQQCAQAIARTHLYEAEHTARSEAEAANRVKDEFLAVLSHELRSPLNPILGWIKLLQGGKLDAAKSTYALATIERNAKLQAKLVEDLLDVSRILQGKINLHIRPVDLIATIQGALETVGLAAEAKSIAIQTYLNSEIGQVLGDSARLQQVMWNLLSNAIKFTPEAGQVKIYLEPVGSQAQIRIVDTGQGIAPNFLPYVFDRFRQADSSTSRQFGGLGLGLAIARHLVELHGGRMWAESPGEGQGATFTISLPLLKATTVNTPETNSDRDNTLLSALPLKGIRILLVEDDIDAQDLTAFILMEAGATTTVAASVKEALAIFNQNQPHILISDIGMPDQDGFDLIKQIRARPASQGGLVPAIALTAYAGDHNQQQILAAGFQQHLTKPVAHDELVKAILHLMQYS